MNDAFGEKRTRIRAFPLEQSSSTNPPGSRGATRYERVDVSGTWSGMTEGNDGRLLGFSMELKQTENTVDGVVTLSGLSQKSIGRYEVHGVADRNVLSYEGIRFLERSPDTNWCISRGRLTYRTDIAGVVSLTGFWGPNPVPSGCTTAGGRISLERK